MYLALIGHDYKQQAFLGHGANNVVAHPILLEDQSSLAKSS